MFETFAALTPSEFQDQIENISWQNDMNTVDAVIYFCDQHGLEPESIGTLLTSSLKTKLKEVYIGLHYLPKSKTKRLPL